MLRQLTADDPRFKSLRFAPGLNLVVSDTTAESQRTDSRNGAGKSSLIELVHFLLGAKASSAQLNIAAHRALRGTTFELLLDWSGVPNGLRVRRRAAEAGQVLLEPDVSAPGGGRFEDLKVSAPVRVDEWNRLVEAELFGLPLEHPGLSGRILMSFLARRVGSHGFNQATLSHSRQSESQATTNLAYLLGLDWRLAGRYEEVKAREEARRQLRKAANDPLLGKVFGSAADLRGQITVAEVQVARLTDQVRNFRVVPEYENLKERADSFGRQIRDLSNADAADRRNLDDLSRAVEEAVLPEVDYVESVYAELGVVLGDQVRRRFSDVYSFHESVVRNRRRYLKEEVESTRARLEERRRQRAELGEEQARLLRLLNEGGALEALTVLQSSMAQEQARLQSLRHRFEAAQTLEASRTEIQSMRARIQQELRTDLDERQPQTEEATRLFLRFAQALYGDGRQAYLAIQPASSSLKIEPRIDSDESRGIENMVIFCFDLTVAVLAHRAGRAPDFLIHDSHIFDGVDARQVANALALAVQVTDAERMQYIVTINSDDLDKAVRQGFDPSTVVREPRLTDAYANGGLFGFRF